MNLSEPYASLRVMPKHLEGWFTTEKELTLLSQSRMGWGQDAILVELGSWLGQSTAWFARHARKVYAVDTWLGSVEHLVKPEIFEEEIATLYPQFLSNMVHEQIADRVVPIRMTTRQAAFALAVEPDVVFVDARHDAQSVFEDIVLWAPKLAKSGVICGDDWMYGSQALPGSTAKASVQTGVTSAAHALGKTVRSNTNLWWLE